MYSRNVYTTIGSLFPSLSTAPLLLSSTSVVNLLPPQFRLRLRSWRPTPIMQPVRARVIV